MFFASSLLLSQAGFGFGTAACAALGKGVSQPLPWPGVSASVWLLASVALPPRSQSKGTFFLLHPQPCSVHLSKLVLSFRGSCSPWEADLQFPLIFYAILLLRRIVGSHLYPGCHTSTLCSRITLNLIQFLSLSVCFANPSPKQCKVFSCSVVSHSLGPPWTASYFRLLCPWVSRQEYWSEVVTPFSGSSTQQLNLGLPG